MKMHQSAFQFMDNLSPFAPVVLEVSDLLRRRQSSTRVLSFKQRKIIEEGIRYLKLVKSGQETVQSSGASIVSEDERLLAYEETNRALFLHPSLPSGPKDKKELFDTGIHVLQVLLEERTAEDLDAEALKQTQRFFRTMEDYYFTGHSSFMRDAASVEE